MKCKHITESASAGTELENPCVTRGAFQWELESVHIETSAQLCIPWSCPVVTASPEECEVIGPMDNHIPR